MVFWGHRFPPKNGRTNSTLILWYLWSTCFCSFFWRKSTTPRNHFEINWPLTAAGTLRALQGYSYIFYRIRTEKEKLFCFSLFFFYFLILFSPPTQGYFLRCCSSAQWSYQSFEVKFTLSKFRSEVHKVHIFWESHKIFAKSPPIIWLTVHTNNWWRFHKILWSSQNIWTLIIKILSHPWQ